MDKARAKVSVTVCGVTVLCVRSCDGVLLYSDVLLMLCVGPERAELGGDQPW